LIIDAIGIEGDSLRPNMADKPELFILYSCPFCWKVRGLIDNIGLTADIVQINPFKQKKQLAFTDGWTKTPVWREKGGEVVVDSTPIMKHIDEKYNDGKLWQTNDQTNRDKWLVWADTHMSKATIPILYGSLGSALKTTMKVSKLEKFGFFSKRIYAWAGFPIMWGIIARKRVKKDGRSPKKLWHDLLDEWLEEVGEKAFFGGEEPDAVDLVVLGYMRSISPYPQFSQLMEHSKGKVWYESMLNTLNN